MEPRSWVCGEASRKAGCQKLARPFDERGWETGRRLDVRARAHPRLYKSAFVDVTVAFYGVPGRFVVIWEIENKTARLVALLLESGGRGRSIPETSTLPRFMDPPLPTNPIATPPGGLIATKS